MHTILHAPGLDRLLEVRPSDAVFEAYIKFRPWIAIRYIPHLGLRFTTKFRRTVRGRMDLDREIVAGIQDLDEKWKARVIFIAGAEDFLTALSPKFMQRASGERSAFNDGLRLFTVHNFP